MQSTKQQYHPLFIIHGLRKNDYPIAYFPLQRLALLIAHDELSDMIKVQKQGVEWLLEHNLELYEKLKALNMHTFSANDIPRVEVLDFQPTEATIILTEACNLACAYCYSSSKKDSETVDYEAAKAVINEVAQNAAKSEREQMSVRLIGGGEPTIEWDLLERIITFARNCAQKMLVPCFIRLITNGTLLDSAKLEFIKREIDFVTLSYDYTIGGKTTRPFRKGGDSMPIVESVARNLNRQKIPFHLRTTITNANVDQIMQIVRHVSEVIQAPAIRLEPVCNVGRFSSNTKTEDFEKKFINGFLDAVNYAQLHEIEVECKQWTNVDRLATRFCDLEFALTTSGTLSGCHRYTRPDHDCWDMFIIGEVDSTGMVRVDKNQVRMLRSIDSTKFTECKNCFAKYNCSGGCLSARLHDGKLSNSGPFCTLTRNLLEESIRFRINNSNKERK
ncbi:MAG: radical SAM protein [Planctomycetes bacterium]|nr:radical SAM protein [Planctomycetota bacterium]